MSGRDVLRNLVKTQLVIKLLKEQVATIKRVLRIFANELELSRTRRNNGAVNQSLLRKLALNLLKAEKASKKKIVLKRKRLKALMDEEFLENVIFEKKD
ncbi:hypothetical protein AN2V17_46060 [Vallitalea sp. AN17-2]|uniref:Uncharacterized protein n=1 Tax=Vallitalea maricola TaxID=3074433 RepID=A0ACB5URM6_9FIRM|nr:hypothetical protein AN2V17_46060 [Vallitalea sp. AN17-2]